MWKPLYCFYEHFKKERHSMNCVLKIQLHSAFYTFLYKYPIRRVAGCRA